MHNRFDENWATFGRFIFNTGGQLAEGPKPTGETKEAGPKAPAEGSKPAPDTQTQPERAAKVEQAKTVGDLEQEISSRFANLQLYPEFKGLKDETININKSFETAFKAALSKFNQNLETWQAKNKKLTEMISTKGRYAEIAVQNANNPTATMDAIRADVLQRIAAKLPDSEGALPSQVNVEHATKEFMAVYDLTGLPEAAQKELADIYKTYFTEMNKAIQEAKLNIKLSKLTDDERKIWYEYGNLNEQQITEKLKVETPDNRKKILDQIASVDKKMKEFEGEAEGVAQELKEGTFLQTLMNFFQELMEFFNRFLGQLGFNAKETLGQQPEELVKKNPIGDEPFVVTSWPGEREAPQTPEGKEGSTNHIGIDVSVKENSLLYAGVDGKVVEAGFNSGYGGYVKIELANGKIVTYAHLNEVSAKKGDEVKPDTQIGRTGNTGVSTGPHLHIELADATGSKLDPMPLFKKYVAHGSKEAPADEAVAKFFEEQNKARQNAVATTPAQPEPKKA